MGVSDSKGLEDGMREGESAGRDSGGGLNV